MARLVGGVRLGAGRSHVQRGWGQPQALRRDAAVHAPCFGVVLPRVRPGGKAFVYFFLKVVPLDRAQGKGAEGTLRPQPGLQAGPEPGGEDKVAMQMQFGLCAGLAIVEAQMLLGVAAGR